MTTHATPAAAGAYLDRRRSTAAAAHDQPGETTQGWSMTTTWVAVGVITAIGVALRLLLVRGIWVDEAISIHQAHMSLSGMLANLQATDNHPPLYFLALWVTVRVIGYSELAVHVPIDHRRDAADPGDVRHRPRAVRSAHGAVCGDAHVGRAAADLVLAGGASVRVLHAVRDARRVGSGSGAARRSHPLLGRVRRASRSRCCTRTISRSWRSGSSSWRSSSLSGTAPAAMSRSRAS